MSFFGKPVPTHRVKPAGMLFRDMLVPFATHQTPACATGQMTDFGLCHVAILRQSSGGRIDSRVALTIGADAISSKRDGGSGCDHDASLSELTP
jgi:hypothetical protein